MKSSAKNLTKRVIFTYKSNIKIDFVNTDPTATTVITISNGTHSSVPTTK